MYHLGIQEVYNAIPRRTPFFTQVVYKHLKNLKVSKHLLCIVHLLLGLFPFVRCLQRQDRYKVPLLLSFYSSFITTRDFTAKSHLQHYSCHTFNVRKHKKDMIVKVFSLFQGQKLQKKRKRRLKNRLPGIARHNAECR